MLFSNILKTAEDHPNLKADASALVKKFETLFQYFGSCHRGYNSTDYMTDKQIDELGT